MNEYQQQQVIVASKTNFANAEVEQALLGCIIQEFSRCEAEYSALRDADLYFSDHKAIRNAIELAISEGTRVDLVTVGSMIDKICENQERAAQLTSYAIGCVSSHVSSVRASDYLKILKELSARRQAIALLADVQRELQDPTADMNGIMDKLRTSSTDLTLGKHSWMTMQEVMFATYDWLERRMKGEEQSITTGIPNVDAIIGGLFPGEMTIIGARPAVGKSVFGMNVAIAAAEKGFKVGICSREMMDVQYGQRVLSYASLVDGMKIRRAQIDDEDWKPLVEGLSIASRMPIDFLFTVRTVEDLRAEVQRKVSKGEIDMLIVDYLQLMSTAQRIKEDRLRVGHISKSLKDIAVDFRIPVIALAQVKRYAGGARAKMPTLEDLKDSGNLEQDADGVIFLHVPYDEEDEYIDPRDRESFRTYEANGFTYMCIGVAKQRQGVTGKACVLLNKRNMHFYGIERGEGA